MNTRTRGLRRHSAAALVALVASAGLAFGATSAGAQTSICDIQDFTSGGVVNTTGYLICVTAEGATSKASPADCPQADEFANAVVDPYQLNPGGKTTFSGYNFAPNSTVEIFVNKPTASLGTFTADGLGNVVVQLTVPSGTSLGGHTLGATGRKADGRSLVACAYINVVGGTTTPTVTGALPRTGSDTGRMAAVGGALILLGGAAVIGSVKTRRTVAS